MNDLGIEKIILNILTIGIPASVISYFVIIKPIEFFIKNRKKYLLAIKQNKLGGVDRLRDERKRNIFTSKLNHRMIKTCFYLLITFYLKYENANLYEILEDNLFYQINFIFNSLAFFTFYLFSIWHAVSIFPDLNRLRKADKRSSISDEDLDVYDLINFGITMKEMTELREENQNEDKSN